jgi:hypothetical protein
METVWRGAAALLIVAMPLAVGAFLVRRYKTGGAISLVMLMRLRPASEPLLVPPPAPTSHMGAVPGAGDDRNWVDASRFSDEDEDR